MKTKILLLGALLVTFLLTSCSNQQKKQKASADNLTKVENASNVVNYYHTSLNALNHLVNPKDINTVLSYMEQRGKGVELSAIPEITVKDTAALMNPGDYFSEDARRNLKQDFKALFLSREQFYANFDKYLTYLEAKDYTKDKQLLDENYRLSIEMSDAKETILDILSPLTEKAENVILEGDPLKDQIMAMRKMSGTMRSIMNLYARKHGMDGMRMDIKIMELKKELAHAEKLESVSGYEEEMKAYRNYLSAVSSFIKDVEKARDKGEYTDSDYDALIGEYGASII